MEELQVLFHNKMLIAPIFGWFVAQVLKTIVHFIMNKEFNLERMIGSGGMPSSHSALVVGLMYATAYCKGINGFEFPCGRYFGIDCYV